VKMKVTCSFDMWEDTYPVMQRHIPEYTNTLLLLHPNSENVIYSKNYMLEHLKSSTECVIQLVELPCW
jgi:hypothetical protein